jgi:hypothetical protein
MGNNYYIHEKTAKLLEQEFTLNVAPRSGHNQPSHKKEEINERNSRVRVKPDTVTTEVTSAFRESGTTKQFIGTLTKAGYTLCRGKNNSLMLVDKQGGYHGFPS